MEKTVVGVLTVIDEEFDAAQTALGATVPFAHTGYWHEPAGHHRFVLARMADRGSLGASDATKDLIEDWAPDIVLLVGIAGGMAGQVGLGDVVIADYIHYSEFRKLTPGRDALRYAAYDQPTVSVRERNVEPLRRRKPSWTDALVEARPDPRTRLQRLTSSLPENALGQMARKLAGDGPVTATPRTEVGGIVAGEKIAGDPDHPEQEHLFVSFDSAVAVDMESYGVARAVHKARDRPDYNPQLSVIRGISDIVHRKPPRTPAKNVIQRAVPIQIGRVEINNEQRRIWKRYASAAAAAFAVAVVDEVA